MTNCISKRIVWMLIVLIAVATAGMLYSHSRSIPEEEMVLAMDFTIDANTDNGAFLRFVTPDGKEKIEVYEGQFSDGTKIFESRNYKHDLGGWEQSTVGQHCPPVQQPHFNTVNLDGIVPDEEILQMIDHAYTRRNMLGDVGMCTGSDSQMQIIGTRA